MAVTVKWSGNLTPHFTLAEYAVNQTGIVKITQDAYEHALIMEEFRVKRGRALKVNAWYRTPAYNKGVSQHPTTSNHLTGCATDEGYNYTLKEFLADAKLFKQICEEHHVVGECGLYSWGAHWGTHIKYSKKFYNWDSRTGVQKNMAFKI